MIESHVKFYGDAWRRNECYPGTFELLRICMREVKRVLGRQEGVTNDFFVGMGLHQGSALSPFLFTLVMDKLMRGIQDELPWSILFADDIVLIDEIRQGE